MKKFFKQFYIKLFGRQLRKPSGFMANTVADKMNTANAFMYDRTIEFMQLQSHEHILEIGYGNGKLFEKILAKADGIKISGIDYSKEMYIQAHRNNAIAIEQQKLFLYHGNSNVMPFDDEYFDKIFCINVIYFWDKPDEHLKEIKRVLKPGGIFYATIRNKTDMQRMPFTKHGFTLYAEDEWKDVLKRNGLMFIETEKISEPPVEVNGKSFQLESLCIAAKKN